MSNEHLSEMRLLSLISDLRNIQAGSVKMSEAEIAELSSALAELQALRASFPQKEEVPVGYVSQSTIDGLLKNKSWGGVWSSSITAKPEPYAERNVIPLYAQPTVPNAGEEIQRLTAERDAANYELAIRNGAEWEELVSRAEAAERENKALREALEPFADLASERFPDEGGAPSIIDIWTKNGDYNELQLRPLVSEGRYIVIDADWFRNARAALTAALDAKP